MALEHRTASSWVADRVAHALASPVDHIGHIDRIMPAGRLKTTAAVARPDPEIEG